MNLRDALAPVVARDPRYAIDAYEFVFAALDRAKLRKRKARRMKGRSRGRKGRNSVAATRHVSGRDLCEAARELALDLYGRLALTVLEGWGLRSTSDLGEIVYNLIASGDFEQSPEDSRDDFADVYDFEAALLRHYVIALDDLDDE